MKVVFNKQGNWELNQSLYYCCCGVATTTVLFLNRNIVSYIYIYKRWKIPKRQSKMNNPEKLAT